MMASDQSVSVSTGQFTSQHCKLSTISISNMQNDITSNMAGINFVVFSFLSASNSDVACHSRILNSEAIKLREFFFLRDSPFVERQKYVDPPSAAGRQWFGRVCSTLAYLSSKMKNKKEAALRSKVILWPVLSDTYQGWKHVSS